MRGERARAGPQLGPVGRVAARSGGDREQLLGLARAQEPHGEVSDRDGVLVVGGHRGQPVEHERRADQAEVRVRLRVVAERALGARVVLLGEQAGRAGELEHLVEQRLRVALAADERVGVREPERAQVEAALAAGQAVVAAVAVDGRALAQAQLDRLDGGGEALVVGGQQAAEADLQRGGVEVDAVVGGRERAHLGLPAVLEDVRRDAVARAPTSSAGSGLPVSAREPQRAVDREPAHHVRVHVVARRARAPPRCRGRARASAARRPRPSARRAGGAPRRACPPATATS